MFTGLVEALGIVREITPTGNGSDLTIEHATIAGQLQIGESMAINGTCLTVVSMDTSTFSFQVGPETLQRTNLGELHSGDRVNLERALRFSDRLGGHLVQGHIDGLATIDQRGTDGEWVTMWFRCAANLAEQMVSKGSVAVDGVSLTVVDVEPTRFSVALIPHTLEHTTLGFKDVGATVNLETDMLAKYVWKYLQLRQN